MWKILSKTSTIIAVGLLSTELATAYAQSINNNNFGLYLPHAPRPNGFDEIRTSDGTTCRSSMSGNGAYLDVGGIGAQGFGDREHTATVYGRVIVPLGQAPDRINCRSLYQLELERLKMELKAARAGLNGAGSDNVRWNNE